MQPSTGGHQPQQLMKTGFIGIGSMGGMLVRALLRSGALQAGQVWAANRSQIKLRELAADFPGLHLASSKELAANCDLIFLCVGASQVAALLREVNGQLHPGKLLVNIAATVPLQALEDRVPCRIAKLIPSITQEVAAGITLLMYGSRVTADDRNLLEKLIGHISRPLVISEGLSRPAIGLTSGGPALLAYVLQCMAAEAALSNPKLSPELARRLVQETATATVQLVNQGNMSWEDIISRVAVPGGMTALSLEILGGHLPQAWRKVFQETAARDERNRASIQL